MQHYQYELTTQWIWLNYEISEYPHPVREKETLTSLLLWLVA